jgi:hypothetical protein
MFSLEYENSSKFKGVPNVPGLHDASHFNYPKSLNRISKKARYQKIMGPLIPHTEVHADRLCGLGEDRVWTEN